MLMTKKAKNGFTLIELMVAISIFASVAVIATGAVLTANMVNKQAQAIKVVMDNLAFALDSMTIKLKSGGNYACFDSNNSSTPSYPSGNPPCPNGNYAIAFQNADNDKIKFIYRFNSIDQDLEVAQSDSGGNMPNSFTRITAKEIVLSNVKFYVVNNGMADKEPRVLISLSGKAQIGHQSSDFAVETTISDRR